jgi:hypothetical protein
LGVPRWAVVIWSAPPFEHFLQQAWLPLAPWKLGGQVK